MACVCVRFRGLCRRRAVAAWLATEGVNALVPAYHPRGHMTTLLHAAAAEGMESAAEMLLLRGANPLGLDGGGRTPLQAARGRARASLVAKLTLAQTEAEARLHAARQRAEAEAETATAVALA